ncbi:MAG: hypothetical protein ACFB21_07270 [Opitutales bacterium]
MSDDNQTPPSEHHPGLFVAGTGCAALKNNLGHDLGIPMDLRTTLGNISQFARGADEFLDVVSMEHRPGQWAPVKTSLMPGRSIVASHLYFPCFTQVPSHYNHFLYDWRADLRHNAQRLLEFITTRKRENERWCLVGHSQGCLLICLASKLLGDPDAFARHVRSVHMVGGPFAGTLMAAEALIGAEPFGKCADNAIKSIVHWTRSLFGTDASSDVSSIREAARSWPSLYQMLPRWHAVITRDGKEIEQGLLNPEVWSEQTHITEDFFTRARETHEMMREPFDHLGDIDVELVLADTMMTPTSFIWENGRLLHEFGSEERGDGVVPIHKTKLWLGKNAESRIRIHDGLEIDHTYLLAEDRIWTPTHFAKAKLAAMTSEDGD